MFEVFRDMIADAIAFCLDSEARQLSKFRYSNGNGMSVREARKRGLIK